MAETQPLRPVRRLGAALVAAIVPVLLGTGWVRTAPPDEESELVRMADAVVDTRQVGLAVLDQFIDSGLVVASATMAIRSCNDFATESSPEVTLLLDQRDGRPSTVDDAVRVRDLLATNGWAIPDSDRFEEGIEVRSTELFNVVASREGVRRIIVRFRNDISRVWVTLLGPCLSNADGYDLYRAITTWDLLGPEAVREQADKSVATVTSEPAEGG